MIIHVIAITEIACTNIRNKLNVSVVVVLFHVLQAHLGCKRLITMSTSTLVILSLKCKVID